MAGGIGSRFWPVSRTDNPKQFLDILGLGKSLLQLTYERFLDICPKENIYIVTNSSYADLVHQQLPDLTSNQVLKEPARKNTAPCIAYFSHKINAINPDANIVVAPSDHIILKQNEFVDIINKGLNATAKEDLLITLGIQPSRPDTGYGYINYGKQSGHEGVFEVLSFREKPTLEVAKTFLESGDFLWNSGMFIWSVKSILSAFSKYLSEVNDLLKSDTYNTLKEKEFIEQSYKKCPSISIDYGVMEKANNVCVIPADFGWSDLGTWSSLYDTRSDKDVNGNVTTSNSLLYDCKDNMIVSSKDKLIIAQDLNDYIVVDTDDALLIIPKSKEQEIKQITGDIKEKGKEQYL